MKNWKRILCLITAAMLAGSSVSVYADEPEEWETEELLETEDAELKEDTEETIQEEILADTEEMEQKEILADVWETQVEEEVTEDTEEIWNTAGTKQPGNPVYNENTDSTKWSYVYFGRYPQNDVTGDDLDERIINANYNKNGDAVVDGVKYRRVESWDEDMKDIIISLIMELMMMVKHIGSTIVTNQLNGEYYRMMGIHCYC